MCSLFYRNLAFSLEMILAGFSFRWNEFIRKIELWAEIHELNEQGTYTPVELQTRDATECGGVFQLRQGFARRIVVQVTVPKQGNLPVVLERIKALAVGSVNVRAKIQKGLDSYQERDLQRFLSFLSLFFSLCLVSDKF